MKINIDIKINSICNMNCSYCMSRSDSTSILDIETEIVPAVKIIMNDNPDIPVNFVILGGEVTVLPKGILTKLVSRLRDLMNGRKYRIHVFTNLKIFSKELYDIYINDKNIYLDISMDTHIDSLSGRDVTFSHMSKNLVLYKDMSRIIINSTLSNIVLSRYDEFINTFYGYGVKIFKIKFERLQGYHIEETNSKGKFIDIIHNAINNSPEDVLFVSNALLNTVLVQEVYERDPGVLAVTVEVHASGRSNRMYRSVFNEVIIPIEKEFEYYL